MHVQMHVTNPNLEYEIWFQKINAALIFTETHCKWPNSFCTITNLRKLHVWCAYTQCVYTLKKFFYVFEGLENLIWLSWLLRRLNVLVLRKLASFISTGLLKMFSNNVVFWGLNILGFRLRRPWICWLLGSPWPDLGMGRRGYDQGASTTWGLH